MGILIRKTEGISKLTGVAKLSVVSLPVLISAALVDTIWALYIDGFVHNEALVGFISSALLFVGIVSYFLLVPFIEKNSKSKIFRVTLLLFAFTYLLFAINTKFYLFVILSFIITILYTLKITSFGIIIRDKSKEESLSRNEGLIYTFMNISWVLGPLIAGFIADKYGVNQVFILSAIFLLIAFFLFRSLKIKDKNISKKIHEGVFRNFKDFFKDKQRTISYIVSGGVNIWWGFIYLFIPLHIIRSGLSDLWVGYFLLLIAVPLILTEYKFSTLIERVGYKRIFKIAYIFVAIISILCFFVSNIYIVLSLLILASFGMAMLEPTTETYFFKILKRKSDENRFYGPYNTAINSGAFIGRILASLLLLILPFKFLFILYGMFMATMFLISFKARQNFNN